MKQNLITRRINSKFLVLLALQVAQYYMQDWKGKKATNISNRVFEVQSEIDDIQEIPFEEIVKPQMEFFTEERKAA